MKYKKGSKIAIIVDEQIEIYVKTKKRKLIAKINFILNNKLRVKEIKMQDSVYNAGWNDCFDEIKIQINKLK